MLFRLLPVHFVEGHTLLLAELHHPPVPPRGASSPCASPNRAEEVAGGRSMRRGAALVIRGPGRREKVRMLVLRTKEKVPGREEQQGCSGEIYVFIQGRMRLRRTETDQRSTFGVQEQGDETRKRSKRESHTKEATQWHEIRRRKEKKKRRKTESKSKTERAKAPDEERKREGDDSAPERARAHTFRQASSGRAPSRGTQTSGKNSDHEPNEVHCRDAGCRTLLTVVKSSSILLREGGGHKLRRVVCVRTATALGVCAAQSAVVTSTDRVVRCEHPARTADGDPVWLRTMDPRRPGERWWWQVQRRNCDRQRPRRVSQKDMDART
ncbi:hypothetical protein C8R45DRAFT_920846 [Mycena sanguinolenta]|nr:hypothetical protein C8R45DRAFT_920846 [Mycena sanguinolenta]